MVPVMIPAMLSKRHRMSTKPLRGRAHDRTLPRRLHQHGHIGRILGQRRQFRVKYLVPAVPATQWHDRAHDVVFVESASGILAASYGGDRFSQVGHQHDITARGLLARGLLG